MPIDRAAVRRLLKAFDLPTVFIEHLGWDRHQARLDIQVDSTTYSLQAIAHKRGFAVYTCLVIPDRPTRMKIDRQVTKSSREHLTVYGDAASKTQLWEWVRREPGKPTASRDYRFHTSQSGDPLIHKLESLAIDLAEEEELTIVDVAGRVKAALDVDKITKRFYDRFKSEHAAFQKFIKGIKSTPDLEWYTSLMLNRLMFVYFIQKKGFLDGDVDYLRNRLARMQQQFGKDKFYSFYRYFLLRLFHEGLGQPVSERDRKLHELLGDVPFLDGGFFEVHDLEQTYPGIDIPDKAFERLFDFFDAYRWHLDERPLRADNEINPDVVGYIFEKYVNQKQMGAYYTKEDITGYISKSTIIPFIFDAAEKKCAIAFKPDSALWATLREDPDRYIYPAVRHGVVDEKGEIVPLPAEIEAGINDVSQRGEWNRAADQPYALPTETWREHVARRQRCLEIREKLRRGEVHQINDLITLNLDIWQFARDAIVNCEGPELLRAFYRTIAGRVPMKSNEKFERGISVLDPACGSGAFLFAALQILESLFADCLERMRRFLDELEHSGKKHRPEKYADFKAVLTEIDKHPNERYFILKSIIINNLFGVDIMEEAVEICKLRLFLKLVAQVKRAKQIEPLPDIDFNIRVGNTLVGYVSLDEVRASVKGLLPELVEKDMKRIQEQAEDADRAYKLFRQQQVRHGGRVTARDKAKLRERLGELDAELDRYLAGEYGVKVEKARDFEAWKTSHQPFHWLVEFFGIMRDGGFDVIIGNPPYVEYRKVKSVYSVRRYVTLACGNLYTLILERCTQIGSDTARVGMIVPLSLSTTSRTEHLRQMLSTRGLWVSCFDMRPSSLFEGVAQRLCILVMNAASSQERELRVAGYRRWTAEERETLLARTHFVTLDLRPASGAPYPKIGAPVEIGLLQKVGGNSVEEYWKDDADPIYVHRICRYFIKALDFIPLFVDADGQRGKSEDYKCFRFQSQERVPILAFLNSSLFYWFWRGHGDGFHCGFGDVFLARWRAAGVSQCSSALRAAVRRLMDELRGTSEERMIRTKRGQIRYQEFYPKSAKPLIDEIDRVLARHFGFEPEELDFVLNYDIKYRMGGSDDDDAE